MARHITNYAGRPFRSQGDSTTTPILKDIHLFLNHIRRITQRAFKYGAFLQKRSAKLFVSVKIKNMSRLRLHILPKTDIG